MDILQSSLKDIILNQKCSKHKLLIADHLHLNPKTNQHRVCIFCIQERGIPEKQLISIPCLFSADFSTINCHFPIDNSILKLVESNFDFDVIISQIDKQFTDTYSKISKALHIWVAEENLKMQNIIEDLKQAQIWLKKYLSVKPIQDILLNQDHNENALHEYILNHFSLEEQRNKEIQETFAKFDAFQSKFSMDKLIQAQEQILSIIKQIDLFSGSNRIQIFPFLYLKQRWDESKLKCVPSVYYRESINGLKIEKLNSGELKITSLNDRSKQCYINTQLSANQKYIIRLEFNNIEKKQPYFQFGLIKIEHKDKQYMGDSTSIFYYDVMGGNTTSVIKGGKLHSGRNSKVGKKGLEFRIDIGNKYWRVASYPGYENVAQLTDSSYIDPKQMYFFAIYIGNQSDYVIINEILEVTQFDNMM